MTASVHRLRAPGAPVLSVLLAGLLLAATVGVDLSTSSAARASAGADPGFLGAGTGLLLVAGGAIVLHHRPRHRVGVLMVGFGLFWMVDGLLESWAAFGLEARPDAVGTGFAFWFVDRFGAFLLLALPLLLLLYPTGRLIPGGWRWVGVCALAAATALPLALVSAPASVLYRPDETVPPVAETDVLTLPVGDDAAAAVLTVAQVVTFASLLMAVAVVFVRHRRARDVERMQLRWLLWAALMCVLSVVVSLLLPATGISYAALVLAVATTAASVTVGIVRPRLVDVDTLVAETVVYAGVAAVVIAVDLAVLAVADRIVGDRLPPRQALLLALVLAVGIYGPLRHWLSRAVRRVFVGRRADRYQVVSTLAARLEQSGDIDRQLPAMAEAVASTFKVSFVRVEVFGSGGDTLSATYGDQPASTRVLPISYGDEQVGRLVLPDRGLRSLLTRRDQLLLLDVVRQGATAVRTTRLAGQLQESREQLVLAREEERRRIRRDLHDGLGPVLGGVAMRLDAAANAARSDPTTSRALVEQSGTDIREALAEVRRLVHDLRPPALDDLGLLAAVEQQAERARAAPMTVDVGADLLDGLPAAVEVAAYRIVAEALNNVVRHAEAAHCDVRLRARPGVLEVEVVDDGKGIAADVPAGVGLLSLRERVEELGGRYEVACPAQGGTAVRAWLPTTEGARS